MTQPGWTTVLDPKPTPWPALLEPIQGRTSGILGSGTGIGFVLIGALIATLVTMCTMPAPAGGTRKWSTAALAPVAMLALLGGLLLP